MTEEKAKRLADEIKGVIDIIALSVATKLQEIAQELAAEMAQETDEAETPDPATEAPKTAPKAPKKAASPAISEDDVRKVLGDKSRAGFTADVKALITKYGVEKVSQLDPTLYAAIIAEAEWIK